MFERGDLVRTKRAVWIGNVLAEFSKMDGSIWYVGETAEGLLWLAPEGDLIAFECTTVKYLPGPNPNATKVLTLVSSKY